MSVSALRRAPVAFVLVSLVLSACGDDRGDRDYLLVPHRPNLLAVVDAREREVVRIHELAGAPPGTVVPGGDGQSAYVLVDRNRRVTGVDLASGEELFRADFGEGAQRVTSPGAMALRPGGNELFVYQHPVEVQSDRYVVGDTRIAVYDVGDGLEAKPVRSFPAERRTMVLGFSPDGAKLYAFSWDIVVYDADSGAELERIPLQAWEREGWSSPDYFDAWPSFERTDLWVAPFVALQGEVPMLGVFAFDFANGELRSVDVEEAGTLIFSMSANPVNRSEAFGAYTTLSKIDLETGTLTKRVDLDHTYYTVLVSSDGAEIYVGGTMDDVGVYRASDLTKLDNIELPSGNDQGLGSLRIVHRALLE